MGAAAKAANYVLTLEEIGNLTREGGKPAETLRTWVPDREAIPHRRLLGLSAGARSREPGARGINHWT
jgi:hypothetical protein